MMTESRYATRQLPLEMTSFVGRRQETADLKHALAESRLVTLVGPGGVGKTRLARHVAAEVRRSFPDGVCLVDLTNVREPSQVAPEVALALDLWERARRDPEAVLGEFLEDKHMLLLLDNCEHVLEASGKLAESMLAASPELRILATSREPLRSPSEQAWQVPPLSLPAADDHVSRRHEAVVLFEERVALGTPGFRVTPENEDVVGRLCQRLDGMPLAIELAAVRMRTLSAEQILERLEDRFRLLTQGGRSSPERQQTLRAAVDWSYDLCTPVERTVWARAAVFTGVFDLEAAKRVCSGQGLSPSQVGSAVLALVDKSLLIRAESGKRAYRMLETIREYGTERLAESGAEPDIRRQHRDYYLWVAEWAEVTSVGPHQDKLAKNLLTQRENLLSAMAYCFDTPGEAAAGLRMATALWYCWAVCGYLRDGRYWLDRGLALNRERSHERAWALWLSGWIAHLEGDHERGVALVDESGEIAEALHDEEVLAFAIQSRGVRQMNAGEFEAGARTLDEALAKHRARGRWTGPGLLTFALRVQAADLAGDIDGALTLLEECRSICAQLGERWALSWAEWNVGLMWWVAGEPAKAAVHLRRSLRDKANLRDKFGITCCVELLAWVAGAEGEVHRAGVLFGAAGRLWSSIGGKLVGSAPMVKWSHTESERAEAALGRGAFEVAIKEGRALELDALVDYALGTKRTAPKKQTKTSLTKREREVADLVAEGLSNKDIAARLVISQRTAESHLDHILAKLGFTSRKQIAAWVAGQPR
ncbi:LuxR C-terminal-related transcriptional regulator [Amycolatopsis pigmentata]|uniref:LuxR C-terminal-related transcriptional regulator n=1 Tax=Amycolatopsis pigmentata TaxID=450801 RepID=A0ABW5G0X0_9PSEU